MTSYKDLLVYQKSIQLVTTVYQLTENYPQKEVFGITNQIRRASISIPSNIAEGSARNYSKEYIQFLHIALGSAAELDTQLEISTNLKYLKKEEYLKLTEQLNEISKLLFGLIRYQKSRL
jgi:four helix bundle protein